MLDFSGITGSGIGQSAKTETKQGEIGNEDFLTLMVTQLKNQDPFNPMDSGEFLSQMASITTATGIQDMQQSFTAFSQNIGTQQALQASALVGREVSVASPTAFLPSDGSLTATISNSAALENLSVDVYTEAGVLVRHLDLGAQPVGDVALSWDGKDDKGVAMDSGRYVIHATTQVGEARYGLDTRINAQVQSVTLGGGGQPPTLSLAGLGEVSLSSVYQIR